jgi:hypothetical protein
MFMKEGKETDRTIVQMAEQLRESMQNLLEEMKPFADVKGFFHCKAKKLAMITGFETESFPPA